MPTCNHYKQVVIGDQLTCKNLRAIKAWTMSEHEPKYRLHWANEVPGIIIAWFTAYAYMLHIITHTSGDFHFLWECLRVVFAIFWGTPTDVGSLCNMKEFIGRKLVTKAVKVFNIGDEFLIHMFKAHFKARICSILNISSHTDDIPHTASLEWLKKKATDSHGYNQPNLFE